MQELVVDNVVAEARRLSRDPAASVHDLRGAVKGLLNILEEYSWTPKERAAIDAIMARQELSEHQTLRMGIKWYQIILAMYDEGYEIVRFQKRGTGELRPIGPTPGCQEE